MKPNKLLTYTPLVLIAFILTALVVLSISVSNIEVWVAELTKWCESIMLACLPYVTILKTLAMWSGVGVVAGGLIFALIKATLGVIRSRLALKGLNLIDKDLGVVLVKDPSRQFAFTYGLFRPRIFISTGIISALSREELQSVILHEAHHKRSYDPLRFLFFTLLKDTLFYLPIGKWFMTEALIQRELDADISVIKKTGQPLELASALIKVTGQFYKRSNTYAHASLKGKGSVKERIKILIGESSLQHTKLPIKTALKSTLIAIALIVFTALPIMAGTVTSIEGCTKEYCPTHHHSSGAECVDHCENKHHNHR